MLARYVNTIHKKRMHRRQMKMETFLRLPPPLSPVIPGIVVDDDDVTNDERRVDDVFIATLDSRVSLRKFLLFVVRKRTKKHTKLQKKCNAYMHKR